MNFKSVLITGGAGTLGRAILRRAHQENWKTRFTIYSRDAEKHRQLKVEFPDVNTVLGDVIDAERLSLVMPGHDVVIHAAANKHIPACEAQPMQAIHTNVYGTQAVAAVAIESGIQNMLLISTDKACNPINVYGATKYLGESIVLSMPRRPGFTQFSVCRYGNVIGSTGSVVQVWKTQLRQGKPITLTHPDMTRFWMTEDDAVNTVLFSLEHPGVISVPLVPALSMADFAAYALGDEVVLSDKMETIGLRPGEKMHEQMIRVNDAHVFVYDAGDAYEYAVIADNQNATYYRDVLRWPQMKDTYYPLDYTSDKAGKLSRSELQIMLGGAL